MHLNLLTMSARASKKARLVATVLLAALVSLSSGPCDESLPPYQEPNRLLTGTISCAYVLSGADNSLKVYLTIKNVFDETLQGPAQMRGRIEIASERDPAVTRTASITSANIMSAPGYNALTGQLTIDPGETIRLGYSWDFADDRGNDLRKSFFKYVQDPTCRGRCLAYTEDLVIRAELTVYAKTGPVLGGPFRYSMCFVSAYVDPGACPPILSTAPCNIRPPQLQPACYPWEDDPARQGGN